MERGPIPAVDPAQRQALLAAARQAADRAYAPYSRFRVGAAVLAEGRIHAGCNVENASFGLTICAERNAVFHAIAAGARRLEAVALACPDAPEGALLDTRMPCGACRQVIAEFARPDIPLFVAGAGDFRLDELLPRPFRLMP